VALKKKTRQFGSQLVHVISTSAHPLFAVFGCMPSIHLMNIITWNKVYALFPRLTFLDHEVVPTLVVHDNLKHYGEQFTKYSKRGWRLKFGFAELEEENERRYGLGYVRRVGDKRRSWVMGLDITGLTRPEKPDFVLEVSEAISFFPFQIPRAVILALCVLQRY
jgi:hypothetical protein